MKKSIIVSILCFTTILSLVIPSQPTYALGYRLKFESILSMESPRDNQSRIIHISPGGSAVFVPIIVKYMVEAPPPPKYIKYFPPMLREIFQMFRNRMIYGSPIVPPMKIHLQIENKPDWMDVSIASPDLYIDIKENEFSYENTSLSIAVYKDAPAQPYTLKLLATSDEMGRIRSQSVEITLPIDVEYVPSATVNVDPPILSLSSGDSGVFQINITNTANSGSIFDIVNYNLSDNCSVEYFPSDLILDRGGEGIIYFRVTAPDDFGRDEYVSEEIYIDILIRPFPTPVDYNPTPANIYRLTLFIIGSNQSSQ